MSPIFLAIREEQIDILSDIYDFNPDINAKDSQGLTPLMFAAKKQKAKVVDMLTLRSKNLDEEDSNQTTILMQFLLEGDLKNARKLVNRGADLNYQNGLG
jgi:ankyrin repeat protein